MNAPADMYMTRPKEILTMVLPLELHGMTFLKTGFAPFVVLPRKILKNWIKF